MSQSPSNRNYSISWQQITSNSCTNVFPRCSFLRCLHWYGKISRHLLQQAKNRSMEFTMRQGLILPYTLSTYHSPDVAGKDCGMRA